MKDVIHKILDKFTPFELNFNHINDFGINALGGAILYEYGDCYKIMRKMIYKSKYYKYDIDINVGIQGETLFNVTLLNNDEECSLLLLKNYNDLDVSAVSSIATQNSIYIALKKDKLEVVSYLLDHFTKKIQPSYQNSNGINFLMALCVCKKEDLIKKIIKKYNLDELGFMSVDNNGNDIYQYFNDYNIDKQILINKIN
jgi:sulfur relay (sulfurtransferase) DsrC/TusE family protein